MLKVTAEYDRNTLRTYLVQFSPASLLGVSTGIFQRALVDEFVMIKAQMGTRNRSENGRSCMGHFVLYHMITVTGNQ
jgi:hypothetical protein